MADHSSSSPPSPRRLNAERGISDSAEGESETHDLSCSPFQPHSHNNAPSPRTLPPPPPTTANSIPDSKARWRRTMLRLRKPMATSHIPQDFQSPFGLNSLPPPNNSPMLQELGPQEKPTNDTNNPIPIINIDDSVDQDSPLSTSTDLEMIKELCSEMEQDLGPKEKPTSDTNNPIPIINIDDSMHQDLPLSTSTHLEMIKELCSEMEQNLGLREKPTSDTNNPIPIINIDDSMHQDSPLSTSTDLEMIKELCSEMEQDLPPSSETRTHPGQDLRHGMEPVSVLRPSTSNVPHITHQTQRQRPPCTLDNIFLQFSGNRPGCVSPESISSNDNAPGSSGVNNQGQQQQQQQQPQRMIITLFPPEDGDPEQDPNIWAGPPPDYYKLNVAVAQCNHGGIDSLGLGAVIRDHFGVAQAALSLMWNNFIDLNLARAESHIYGLGIIYSLRWGYYRLIAETESLWLVEQFRGLAAIPGSPFRQFTYFHARQVSRNANSVAHRFARMGPVREDVFWTADDIAEVFGSNLMPY